MGGELPREIKKNLLDLQYNKYLQYFNTSVILLFTYFIGVGIAFVTKQVDYTNTKQLSVVAILSVAVVVSTTLFMLNFKEHMKSILEEIKKLSEDA